MDTVSRQSAKSYMESKEDYDHIVTPITEIIPNALNVHYGVFWTLIGAIATSLQVSIIHEHMHGDTKALWAAVVFGLLPFATIIAGIYFSKLLERFTPTLMTILAGDREENLAWYTREIKSIFFSERLIASGVTMTAVIIWASRYDQVLNPEELLPKASFLVALALEGMASGALLYSLVRIMWMIRGLGKKTNICVSIYQHPLTSIRAIGLLMTKMSVFIVVLYSMGISYTLACSQDLIGYIFAAVFGGFVLLFFTYPQFKVHTIMSRVKHQRLIEFSTHLEKALEDVTADPSDENINQARELIGIQRSLNEMNDWPFDLKMIGTLMTSVAIPFALPLIESLCRNYGLP